MKVSEWATIQESSNEFGNISNNLSTNLKKLSNKIDRLEKQSRRNRWVGPIRKGKSR